MFNMNKMNKYLPEICTLGLYIILMMIIMHFHEPWYDEAQAWLIARDASLKEILFELPHYEGHPPIWHLILLPFAKLGAPYELSLKFVSLIFSSIAMGLFIFKAPFNRIIRLTIPFTYFFFYQYGVLSRPYCVMMLGFVLAAMFYRDKDNKPFRFILSLVIICSSSAYGIIICAGICVVWIIENFKNSFSMDSIKEFIKNKKFLALCTLFIYNLILVIGIMPKADTFATNILLRSNKYLRGFIYYFFILPGDATYLDICNYNSPVIEFDIYSVYGILVSVPVIISLILIAKQKNKLMLLILPYTFISIFCSFVYFCSHHIGVITLFFMFILWCCEEDGGIKLYINSNSIKKIIMKESDLHLIKVCPKMLLGFVIGLSIIYSAVASINEINSPYGEGRGMAEFIKQNNLTKYNIMAAWSQYYDENSKETKINTSLIQSLAVLPYFKENIFYNFNEDLSTKSYILHKIGRDKENIKLINKHPKPDIIVGYSNLDIIFDDDYSYDDYVCVYNSKESRIWKTQAIKYETPIYIRKDLMGEFPNLKEVED